jgi:hypothetical protein
MSDEKIKVEVLKAVDHEDYKDIPLDSDGKLKEKPLVYKLWPGQVIDLPEHVARYLAAQGFVRSLIVEAKTVKAKG